MDSYSKSYKNDIYFFLPMTAVDQQRFFRAMEFEDRRGRAPRANEDAFGKEYCNTLAEHVDYECSNPTFRSLRRYYLGEFALACYDDNYDGTVIATERAHLFVTAHRKTGLCIVTVAVHDNTFIPTQLIDQMSTEHLNILVPEKGEYISVEGYMNTRFGLRRCGESKCVVCLSNKPADELELAYMLAGETYVSEHIDYHLHPDRVGALLENHACYDYYESYISRSVVAFVFKDYEESIFDRLDDEASVLFVVEIVLFQNTAVLRTNRRVVESLGENENVSNEEIKDLYLEFGRTMGFWSTDIFKYPFSQMEADEVIRCFGISKALEEYHRNQSYIDRLIEIKSTITNERSSNRMNFILYVLAWVQSVAILLSGLLWILQSLLRVQNTTWWGIGCVVFSMVVGLWIYTYIMKGKE
ncbi:MAG: hypothetical protein IJO76_07735 [Clostridia bacterium]|nr:hypothetical protein [Clostridia bacterium]